MSLAGKWFGFGRDPNFDAGLRAFEADQFVLAAEMFREVLKSRVDEDLKKQARSFLVNSLSNVGRRLLKEGKPIDAREAFREALGLAPRYPDLWLGLAMAAGRLEDEATERGALEKARELNPTYARAILYEGLMALKSGDSALATEILAQLPDDSGPEGPPELLIDALEATFASEGDEANVLAAQGDQALKDGDIDIAAALYRQAAQLQPGYADIRCKLGQALLELDSLEDAEGQFREALALNPQYAEGWAQLGIALKRQKKMAEARQAFLKAYALEPHHPIAKMEIKRIR